MTEDDLIEKWRALPTADEVYNTHEYKNFAPPDDMQFRRGQVFGYQQALLLCAAELEEIVRARRVRGRQRRV